MDYIMSKNSSGAKEPEKPKEEVKIFKAKSMIDGDLRMPKALREKITFLKPHVSVTFEILDNKPDSVTLKISEINLRKTI